MGVQGCLAASAGDVSCASLQTMKKKFFVMRRESEAGPARLECYDSEKKWKAGALPKRTVVLRLCFNINRRADAKHRHVVTLHTRDDSYALVAESEEDLEAWLTEMLRLQHGSHELDGDTRPKPLFGERQKRRHVAWEAVKVAPLTSQHYSFFC